MRRFRKTTRKPIRYDETEALSDSMYSSRSQPIRRRPRRVGLSYADTENDDEDIQKPRPRRSRKSRLGKYVVQDSEEDSAPPQKKRRDRYRKAHSSDDEEASFEEDGMEGEEEGSLDMDSDGTVIEEATRKSLRVAKRKRPTWAAIGSDDVSNNPSPVCHIR